MYTFTVPLKVLAGRMIFLSHIHINLSGAFVRQ